MTTNSDRTTWFPKDSLLFVLVNVPLWGIAGLVWGLLMSLTMSGSLIGWFMLGLLWGASVWFFFCLYMLIAFRELSTSTPLREAESFAERLGKVVKPLRYRLEQQSPTLFVCKPKQYGLLRLFSFEFNKLHVRLREGHADLIGPAAIVKKVRKKLAASSPSILNSSGSRNQN